ncbi:MAG: hypothetical protein IB616_03435 [Methanosarcinales archaeon]|nr:MAG: hypothetical protein IB616_03435 [Methanosarcinales archaeon]
MINLSYEEIERLRHLLSKARVKQASGNELDEIVNLINKSGASTEYETTCLLNEAGFLSIQELSKHIQEKKSEEFINALITIGFAILVGSALLELLSER